LKRLLERKVLLLICLVYLIGGATPKFFGCAKSAAYGRRSTSDLWLITHNIGIADKQKSCVMCVKFCKE